MDERIFDGSTRTTAPLAVAIDPRHAGNGVAARRERIAPGDEHDFDWAVARTRAAIAAFVDGKPGAWKAICSHAADATLFGGWGGHERGWAELDPRYAWAAARWESGEVTFEEIAEIARHVGADLACTVHFERSEARLAGVLEPVAVALRVTHLYRREDGEWKLLHRHADPLVAIQATASVVDHGDWPPLSPGRRRPRPTPARLD